MPQNKRQQLYFAAFLCIILLFLYMEGHPVKRQVNPLLLEMNYFRNIHSPDLSPRTQHCGGGGGEHHQDDQPQGPEGNLIGRSPACRDQILVQKIVKGKSKNAANGTAGEGVCAGLRRKHSGKLPTAHADGSHGSILPHPCRSAHGNAVDNMKAGNQHNHHEKAV